MKIVYIAAALSLVSFPALAQEPTFSCQITGSDKSGLEIDVYNPTALARTCSARCTATGTDGNDHWVEVRQAVEPNEGSPGPTGGAKWADKTYAQFAPLSNVVLGDTSCQ
jgi:hypothetical protein